MLLESGAIEFLKLALLSFLLFLVDLPDQFQSLLVLLAFTLFAAILLRQIVFLAVVADFAVGEVMLLYLLDFVVQLPQLIHQLQSLSLSFLKEFVVVAS